MEIRLKARLSAYSKLDSIESLSPSVPNSAIDTLFDPTLADTVVTKGDIDTLFTNNGTDRVIEKDEIDTLFNSENVTKVTYAEIDRLFN